MKRAVFIVVVLVLLTILKSSFNNTYKQPVETSVSSASELDGTWRELLSTHTRGFDGQGSTWIEAAKPFGDLDENRQKGSYRILETGKIEIHMQGEKPKEWTVSFNGDVLRLQPARGETIGYVNASKMPHYAPMHFSDGNGQK